MGRKAKSTGAAFAGAVGRRTAAKISAVLDATNPAEIELANEVQRLAAEHTEAAIDELSIIMQNADEKGMARVAAAKVILEYAHGRPSNRAQAKIPKIQVQILNLTNGRPETPEDAAEQEASELESFLAQKALPQ